MFFFLNIYNFFLRNPQKTFIVCNAKNVEEVCDSKHTIIKRITIIKLHRKKYLQKFQVFFLNNYNICLRTLQMRSFEFFFQGFNSYSGTQSRFFPQ